eukprot:13268152-Alexandrium_andersonii.AAC.1
MADGSHVTASPPLSVDSFQSGSLPKGLGGRNGYPPAGTARRSGGARPRALAAWGLRKVLCVLFEEFAKPRR